MFLYAPFKMVLALYLLRILFKCPKCPAQAKCSCYFGPDGWKTRLLSTLTDIYCYILPCLAWHLKAKEDFESWVASSDGWLSRISRFSTTTSCTRPSWSASASPWPTSLSLAHFSRSTSTSLNRLSGKFLCCGHATQSYNVATAVENVA